MTSPLSEALEIWEQSAEFLPLEDTEAPVFAAARILLAGQPIQWCETHEQRARPGAESCIMESYLAVQGATLAHDCHIVPKLLCDPPQQ